MSQSAQNHSAGAYAASAPGALTFGAPAPGPHHRYSSRASGARNTTGQNDYMQRPWVPRRRRIPRRILAHIRLRSEGSWGGHSTARARRGIHENIAGAEVHVLIVSAVTIFRATRTHTSGPARVSAGPARLAPWAGDAEEVSVNGALPRATAWRIRRKRCADERRRAGAPRASVVVALHALFSTFERFRRTLHSGPKPAAGHSSPARLQQFPCVGKREAYSMTPPGPAPATSAVRSPAPSERKDRTCRRLEANPRYAPRPR